jgi:ribonuclease HII
LAVLLDDSKKLSAGRREAAGRALQLSGASIGLGAASVGEILRLNILQASLLAMRRAYARLDPPPDAALVDGNRDPDLPCPTRCVIRGDGVSLSIAAASIIAKITRDRLMTRLDARHPGYGWAANAGYGAPAHLAALRELGPTAHHRTGFAPVRALLQQG